MNENQKDSNFFENLEKWAKICPVSFVVCLQEHRKGVSA